ncbi:MAG: aminoacyl-tRNA hydrolase [Armatimonadota bacterium]
MLFQRASSPGPASNVKLVVGLGNIGVQYAHTRHNIGFEVADEIARRHNVRFRSGKFKGEEATIQVDGQKVLLLKPHTLMNLSGEAVAAAVRFFKLAPSSQLLVICDDINLPVGKLRFRAKGGDGGHNGLWSIIHRLGNEEFPRLRIGVGAPPPYMDMADYVLARCPNNERALLNETRDQAAVATETWVTHGIEAAMNRWNMPQNPPKKSTDREDSSSE